MNLKSAPAELIAIIQSDADLHAKALACQQLAVVGGVESVPALASLLGHERLADYARSGLEVIPSPEATEALMKALPALKGPLLAGAVDSLGVRRAAAAVPDLQKLAADPGRGVVDEALSALGKIATPEALATLRDALTKKPVAAVHAALAAAARFQREGKREAALSLLDSIIAVKPREHLLSAAIAMRGD